MSTATPALEFMRTVRFHRYGEPADVLRLDEAPIPSPGPGRVRAAVHACGLNPADWALCRGLFASLLPRGIGLEITGTVDAIGEGVVDVAVGDRVIGVPDYANCTSAGLADYAILQFWTPLPSGIDPVEAAALPMVVETAFRSIDSLAITGDHTLVVHGAGTMVGFAAVQIARMRGARVIATTGSTFADQLQKYGATVTSYGEGMIKRVRDIAGETPDFVLDTSPPGQGILPDLVAIAGGDPKRVLTITDMAAAKEIGVRNSFDEGSSLRYDVLDQFAALAAESKFTIPIARRFPFDAWRTAMKISLTGQARGKLLIVLRETA
ncbi:MAG: NADP-dependent oxidoreductase [Janthinobacterium lividum]